MEKALFAKLIKSVQEAGAIRRGEMPASRRFVVTATTQKQMPTASHAYTAQGDDGNPNKNSQPSEKSITKK